MSLYRTIVITAHGQLSRERSGYEPDAVAKVHADLANITKNEMTRMFAVGAKKHQELIKEYFDSPSDNNWSPYSKAYKKTPPVNLQVSGKLKSSIEYNTTSQGWVVRSNVKYGDYHQDGTSRMPARPFLVFTNGMLDKVVETMINQYLDDYIIKASVGI